MFGIASLCLTSALITPAQAGPTAKSGGGGGFTIGTTPWQIDDFDDSDSLDDFDDFDSDWDTEECYRAAEDNYYRCLDQAQADRNLTAVNCPINSLSWYSCTWNANAQYSADAEACFDAYDRDMRACDAQ